GRIESLVTGRVAKVLRATALSLSHLTWSFGTTTATIRTCHPTTSFPVYLQNSTQPIPRSSGVPATAIGMPCGQAPVQQLRYRRVKSRNTATYIDCWRALPPLKALRDSPFA